MPKLGTLQRNWKMQCRTQEPSVLKYIKYEIHLQQPTAQLSGRPANRSQVFREMFLVFSVILGISAQWEPTTRLSLTDAPTSDEGIEKRCKLKKQI